jgi:hypothetical protein
MSLRRRELLKTGCAAVALPLVAGAAPAAAQGTSDADLLAKLLEVEQEASLVYGTLADARVVPARRFREQAREHISGLETALRNRGGRPPAPRARVGRATPKQALQLEERAIEAYSRVVGDFGDETLVPTLAAAMANHGQHAVVLRLALRRDPLPAAFPAGGVR